MKTKKLSVRMMVMLLAMAVSAFALVGGTIAWFTDTVESSNNIIASGTLDVEMFWANGKEDPANATWMDASAGCIFNYDKWEPGYTEVRHIQIKNVGSLALKYQLIIAANGMVSKLADVIDVLAFWAGGPHPLEESLDDVWIVAHEVAVVEEEVAILGVDLIELVKKILQEDHL